MRGLKSLVIGMGFLIVIGLTIVIVTVIKRYSSPDNLTLHKSPHGISAPVDGGFGERRLPIPQGAKILDTTLDGERIVIILQLVDESQAVLLINAVTGNRLGLIRLSSE
ncbi:MAG: hypothetical protein VX434_02300 [Pseudomonadota bacterium]|nr:hypothetical protein [Pseudomonadota bacterium]